MTSLTRPPARRRPKRSATRHVRQNRAAWDRYSRWYDHRFERVLGGSHAQSWGLFRIPEDRLALLGSVRGKRTLEVGCGAARWSAALATRGARAVGIDLSTSQLAHARRVQKGHRAPFALFRGSVERLPFRDDTFDLVFCDWGAMTFADPVASVPECSRVLRRGGAFVFATAHPFRFVAFDVRADRQVRRLVRPYFGSYRFETEPGDTIEFYPPYGVWVDLFRTNGLRVERLIETRPTSGQRSEYLSKPDAKWARSWPVEAIWKLVKE